MRSCLASIAAQRGAHRQVQLDLAPQAPLGQHAVHRVLNNSLWDALLQARKRLYLEAAGPPTVPVVLLLRELLAGDLHLLGVDDDDAGAHVHGGRVRGQVLAADHSGCKGGEATERLACRVDDEPAGGARSALLCACIEMFARQVHEEPLGA